MRVTRAEQHKGKDGNAVGGKESQLQIHARNANLLGNLLGKLLRNKAAIDRQHRALAQRRIIRCEKENCAGNFF